MDGEVIAGAWLLNGPFEMDQGRRGLHGKASDKVEEFRKRGGPLGDRLVALHQGWAEVAAISGLNPEGRDAFFDRLVDLMYPDIADDLTEALHVLERNLQRAAELVGSFKQLAVDQSSYQRRSFALAEVVQEVLLALSPTLRRSPVQLHEQVPPGLVLDSYPGPLGQVLCHGDAHGGNNFVVADAAGQRSAVFFDFDEAGPGLLAYELAVYPWSLYPRTPDGVPSAKVLAQWQQTNGQLGRQVVWPVAARSASLLYPIREASH